MPPGTPDTHPGVTPPGPERAMAPHGIRRMNNQRLGYQRLAEALIERDLVEPQAVQDALSMANHGGLPFPEALVTASLVSDWELSQVVCQLYSLPFLTVEMAEPDLDAQRGLDVCFLIENGLVPLSRHGQILTMCMPAIVPAEVLGCIAAESDLTIMAVVGTVQSNRRWIQKNVEPDPALPSTDIDLDADGGEWGNLFDEADAAVLQELDVPELDDSMLEEANLEDSNSDDSTVELPELGIPEPKFDSTDEETIL